MTTIDIAMMSDSDDSQHVYMYKNVTFDPHIVPRGNLTEVERFNVRQDDIFIASYPRSGTHWLTEMVLLIMADGDVSKVNRRTMDQVFEMTLPIDPSRPLRAGYKAVEEWPVGEPRVVLTHLPAELLPLQLWQQKGAKVVYIARNVLDVLASQYQHLSAINLLPPATKDWPKFIQFKLSDKDTYSGRNWFSHVTSYWRRRSSNEKLLFLKYEDIKTDHRKAVRDIAEFLQRPLAAEQIDRVVELTTFDGMMKTYQQIEAEDPSKIFRTRALSVEPFLKKGIVGNWKGKYSDEQLATIKKKVVEHCGSLGLHFEFETKL
ncbi:sulfotransferase family cytosolic 1B member 1-like isoform X1 [Patiria miniata]|uniref:Sulfotransferase domain-containing protein n=1 Tax=Patiria miniata TaxID=46514 RepID=A0A913ZJD1_PATMI|nr:sulfotransferase family cytosolic 1B member 1-like isoform X1 [Patiria miniata]